MIKPKIPQNEIERLQSLHSYDIVGTDEQEDYDFLTKMVAEICGTKISLISIVTEDKQWFLSHHGLNAKETDREVAFCAHAINTPKELLLVEDSRLDERFHDNPLVTDDPHVIFYAGMPLVNSDGHAMGTLCAIDDKPNQLSEHQKESLRMLSRQVIQLLEYRKKKNQLDSQIKEINYQRNLLNSLFELSPIGIALNDFDTGQFMDVNSKFLESVGYSSEEFFNLSYWDITPKEYEPDEIQAIHSLNSTGFYGPFQKEYIAKGGKRYPVELKGALVEDLSGKKLIWSFIEDITERVNYQNDLKQAKKIAEDASKAKSEFVAGMSHEIRTPLNGVIGFTDLLKTTELTPVQEQYVNSASISGHALLGIINDILDFSKIEAGMLELESVKTNTTCLLENCIELVRLMAIQKNIKLILNLDKNIPSFTMLDPVRLKQILTNLLSNAIKFTSEGEVELKVDYIPTSDAKGILKFSVRDTGIGISESQRIKLFKAFSQADTSTTRQFGGSGLGLVISDLIAKKMGSKIQMKSEPGKGSIFYFDVEIENMKAENLTSPEEIPSNETSESKGKHSVNDSINSEKNVILTKCKILVVEDNLINRKLMKSLLSHIAPNALVVDAMNGMEAIEIIRNDNFDLVLMDIQMPIMDGWQATKEIRKLPKDTESRIPIIALTAGAFKEEMDYSLSVGMNAFLTKPIEKEKVFNILKKYIDS
jgi:PAS domain S-box-containing protein